MQCRADSLTMVTIIVPNVLSFLTDGDDGNGVDVGYGDGNRNGNNEEEDDEDNNNYKNVEGEDEDNGVNGEGIHTEDEEDYVDIDDDSKSRLGCIMTSCRLECCKQLIASNLAAQIIWA
jgi:hypothetical protein